MIILDQLDKLDVIVQHINHSCFTVEFDRKILVFDYFKGDIDLKDKDIYVFSSHDHGDHFNPVVLDWEESCSSIQYIFSNDIVVEPKENIHFLGPYKEKTIDFINIKTFGSTDKGVSFLVSVDGISIFHAGDLNWWYWDDDTEKEKMDMENSFKKKVQRIKDTGLNIDMAFFPVDPRLEEYFHLGGEYFINEINPKYFFPMHAWDQYAISQKFIHKIGRKKGKGTHLYKAVELSEECPQLYTNIVDIAHHHQVFEL